MQSEPFLAFNRIGFKKRYWRVNPFWWHLMGMPLVVLLGLMSRFGFDFSRIPEESHAMVFGSAIAYAFSAWYVSRFSRFPGKATMLAVLPAAALSFLILAAFLLLGRFYYSRGFLLVVFTLTTAWLFLGFILSKRLTPLTLAVTPFGSAKRLMEAMPQHCITLHIPTLPQAPVDAVVADLHSEMPWQWSRFLADCALKNIPIHHAATVFETLTGRVSLVHLSHGHLEGLLPSPTAMLGHRLLDYVLLLFILPLALPLMLVIALAIKLDSKGKVFFVQERIGQHNKPFEMIKFRSMHVDAEKNGAAFALQGDPRITRVGKIIRSFRLDELPQIFNIMKGEMSFIGPRPEQGAFAEQFMRDIPFYGYRHVVKPGITGWAQVSQGYTASVDATYIKLEHDFFYLKHLSITLDLYILARTVWTVLSRFGAR